MSGAFEQEIPLWMSDGIFHHAARTGESAAPKAADNSVAVFSSLEAMTEKGFTAESPEYQAAQIYFAQSSNPGKVAIGYHDSENETLAEAIAACRVANCEWYGVVPLGSVQNDTFSSPSMADVLMAAAYVEAATPATVLFATVDNATTATLNGISRSCSLVRMDTGCLLHFFKSHGRNFTMMDIEPLSEVAKNLFPLLITVLDPVVEVVKTLIGVVEPLMGVVEPSMELVSTLVSEILPVLVSALKPVIELLYTLINSYPAPSWGGIPSSWRNPI